MKRQRNRGCGETKPEMSADCCRTFLDSSVGDAEAESRPADQPTGRPASPPGMDLEEAFQLVGEFGPYQKRAVAVLVLTQVGKRETGCFNGVLQPNNPGSAAVITAALIALRGFQDPPGGL